LSAVSEADFTGARGIEGREIFKDDQDRRSFLERLAIIIEETQTQCSAWALIPDHILCPETVSSLREEIAE